MQAIALVAAMGAPLAKFHHLWFATKTLDAPVRQALRACIGDLRLSRCLGMFALSIANTAASSLLIFFYFLHPEYFTPARLQLSPEARVLFIAAVASLAATLLLGEAMDAMIIRRLESDKDLTRYESTLKWNRAIFHLSFLVLLILAFCTI